MINDEASKNSIMENLELISQKTRKDDRFIFFFAGHGATRQTPDSKEIGYLAAVDSKPNQWHTCLRITDDITRYSYLIGAKHILYIFDACFSGLALNEERDCRTTITRFEEMDQGLYDFIGQDKL